MLLTIVSYLALEEERGPATRQEPGADPWSLVSDIPEGGPDSLQHVVTVTLPKDLGDHLQHHLHRPHVGDLDLEVGLEVAGEVIEEVDPGPLVEAVLTLTQDVKQDPRLQKLTMELGSVKAEQDLTSLL